MAKIDKKGSLTDIITLIIIIGVFSVTVLVAFVVSDNINNKIQQSDQFNAGSKDLYSRVNNVYTGAIDHTFLLLFICLSLVAFALAALVRVHPIFIVFYLMMLVVVIFVAGIISNIYLEMANNSSISTQAAKLTFISHLMGVAPFIIGVIGFVLAIIMYKNYQEGAV